MPKGEADNSEYWDALARGLNGGARLAGPAPVAFGGYVAVPRNHGDAELFAWWTDGRLAVWNPVTRMWHPHPSPDYTAVFVGVPAPFVTAASNATVGEGPRPEADQPRPDDADDTEYPRTRRGRDD